MAYAPPVSVRRNHLLVSSLALVGAAFCMHAQAASMCVQASDYPGLQAALATAAINGEDDVIMLQAGQYTLPGNVLLDYEPAGGHQDLVIDGGYYAIPGGACGGHAFWPVATTTVLDGGLWRLKMQATASGSISLKGLTIANTANIDPSHAPVEILGGADSTSNVNIDNVRFSGNTGANGAMNIFAGGGALFIHNALFDANATSGQTFPIRLGSNQVSQNVCTEIINSTFVDNASSTYSVDVAANCKSVLANDIFWAGPNGDLVFAYPALAMLINDDLADPNEADGTSSFHIASVDPLFDTDFSLLDLSPLHDAGDPGGFLFTVGTYDLIGNSRIYNAKPDMGAYEMTDVIYANGLDFQLPF